MDITKITSYKINDKLVWSQGESLEKLEALINRKLPTALVKRDDMTQLTTPAVVPQAPKAAQAPAVAKPAQAGSKKALAIAIYNEMVGASKADVIARFMTELSMSAAGAQTYYYTAKKG
jgi:hypothetical protein